MNTGNYYENDEDTKNEIKIEDDKLALEQFVLNDEKNRNTQVLFYEVLKTLIVQYNTLSEKERREELVFYLKDDHILLGNIKEEVVQTYYNYKSLFNNLMAGKTMFFREFIPKLDSHSNKPLSANNNINRKDALSDALVEYKNHCDYESVVNQRLGNYESYEDFCNKQKKIKYNLNHFSFYFNGMYFESIALETFFKLIDDKYDIINNDNKLISFLPRIIFFMKAPKEEKKKCENKEENDFYGYSEIGCGFILKGKEEVIIEKEKITCFNNFDSTDENVFFKQNNFVNLRIEKDNVVFLEVKSRLESVIDKNDETNILKKFINKALKFVGYYEELNLIKKDQKIVLIFLYNSSMHYDIKIENSRIKDAYELIEGNQRIKLYIAYFQPYLKLMNSYQRVKELKELKKTNKVLKEELEIQKNKQLQLENDMNKMKNDYIKTISDLVARVKLLEKNQGNINANKEKDHNSKDKKNSITTIETSSGTVVNTVDVVD